jgi:hypothetical protein
MTKSSSEPTRAATDTWLQVGGRTRAELRGALLAHGVLMNTHAETLLDDPVFDLRDPEVISVTECRVGDLGLNTGATLHEVFTAALDRGLALCPPDAAPYLRMVMTSQANAPDSVLSAGKSPAGALKVASAPLRDDADYPKGFYLRVVDGRLWLRGYRCDDEYRFDPGDQFAFRQPVADAIRR